jgi:hypothetical protein
MITKEGKQHLKENQDILKYLLINDFTYTDLTNNLRKVEQNRNKKKIEIFDENVIIQEGTKRLTEVAVYERSSTLRNYPTIRRVSKVLYGFIMNVVSPTRT